MARNPNIGYAPVHFVSPILSAICAAACANECLRDSIKFIGDAGTYAANNGLLAAIAGQYSQPDGAGRQGVTYSPLTRLRYADEVEICNQVIADLLYTQFGGGESVTELARVVGELHDNVASHANGVGFSCAQVYSGGGRKRIEFGIADIGCGMLENVRRVKPEIESHELAICWCLKRGNTSARAADDFWAQRIPDDGPAPFGGPVYRDEGGNHHAGLGLFNLRRLVRLFGGHLWIWTGDSQIIYTGGVRNSLSEKPLWRGVAIEFEVTVPALPARPVRIPSDLIDLESIFG